MPYAVAHMLIPMLILDIIRHKIPKIKRELSNRYVLIVGLAGLLPDIDIPFSFLFTGLIVHRGITHTVWAPLTFFLLFLIFQSIRKFNLSKIFLMISIGVASHIVLDFITAGSMQLFYPLIKTEFAINLISRLFPYISVAFAYTALDAIALFAWLARMALKRKVQDLF